MWPHIRQQYMQYFHFLSPWYVRASICVLRSFAILKKFNIHTINVNMALNDTQWHKSQHTHNNAHFYGPHTMCPISIHWRQVRCIHTVTNTSPFTVWRTKYSICFSTHNSVTSKHSFALETCVQCPFHISIFYVEIESQESRFICVCVESRSARAIKSDSINSVVEGMKRNPGNKSVGGRVYFQPQLT